MDCLVGAMTGALKVVDLKNQKFRNANAWTELKPKRDGIVAICAVDKSETEFLIGQRNGQVNVFSTLHDTYNKLLDTPVDTEDKKTELKSIQTSKNNTIVTANSAGNIRMWLINGSCSSMQMEAGHNLECFRVDPLNVEVAASGGLENPLKLWDLDRGETVFTARNVRDSALSLRVPVWITDVCFTNDSRQLCTTTGYRQIRLYDPKAQRRPTQEFKWGENPITTLATCHRDAHILAGNSRGDLALFDLRGKIRPIQKYRGFSGSIRSIHAHPTKPFLAACGIDRFMMVYNLDTRKQVNKIYCKTKLSAIYLRSDNSLVAKNKEDGDNSDDELESKMVTDFFED